MAEAPEAFGLGLACRDDRIGDLAVSNGGREQAFQQGGGRLGRGGIVRDGFDQHVPFRG